MHKGNPQGVSTAQHNLYLSQFLCVCVWGALIHLGFFFPGLSLFSFKFVYLYTETHTWAHTHTHWWGWGGGRIPHIYAATHKQQT